MAQRRAVWLAAQCTVAAIFVLTLVPQTAQLSLLPALAAPGLPPAPAPLPAAAPRPALSAGADLQGHAARLAALPGAADIIPATAAPAVPPSAWPPAKDQPPARSLAWGRHWAWQALCALAWLWAAVYLAGLARALWRLWRGHYLWRALLASAARLDDVALQAHGGFGPAQLAAIRRGALAVVETAAPVSPVLLGVLRPTLLLPRHLRHFDPVQQQMIVEHELTHWRRHDPAWLAASAVLRTLCWFDPALRWLAARLAMAQELGCDRRVLAGRPQQQRQQYAAALVRQLRAQALPAAAMAFGGEDGHSIAARVRLMRQPVPTALGRRAGCALAGLFGAVLAAGALLQPVLATPQTAVTPAMPAAAAVQPAWRYPLERMRVTAFFGVLRGPLQAHHGIDLTAARGTPVHAVAAGTVVAAGPLAERDGQYGTAVIVDHGGLRTLYAHLQQVAVQPGQQVTAGQTIGASGASGKATGPHLHLEVLRGEQRIDPQTMLAGLDQLATPRALRIRQQQLGH